MKKLFTQFSFPGGVPSHVAPETPDSINEGGELGYCLAHAYGAAFDNPDLLVACVVGDGEAETGPLATSWHSNKFLNPLHDGAVLPILHLNGYKIAGPTLLARIPREELEALFAGYGYGPYFVEGDDPEAMHQLMAATLDAAIADIQRLQRDARNNGVKQWPRWSMIILRSPKGWTGIFSALLSSLSDNSSGLVTDVIYPPFNRLSLPAFFKYKPPNYLPPLSFRVRFVVLLSILRTPAGANCSNQAVRL